jgi:hypothetical protein
MLWNAAVDKTLLNNLLLNYELVNTGIKYSGFYKEQVKCPLLGDRYANVVDTVSLSVVHTI